MWAVGTYVCHKTLYLFFAYLTCLYYKGVQKERPPTAETTGERPNGALRVHMQTLEPDPVSTGARESNRMADVVCRCMPPLLYHTKGRLYV